LPFGAVFGREATVASATGVGWLLLLVMAVAACASAILPRGTRLVGASAAAAALALVPAIHGGANRYYYDLPMIALIWCAAAILLWGRDRRPVLAGVSAGVIGSVACLVKWATIPYGAILVVALLFGRGGGDRGARPGFRILACCLAMAIPAYLTVRYLGDVVGTSSFGHQAHITVPGAEGTDIDRGAFGARFALLPGHWSSMGAPELLFYPLRAAVSVFSPLLFGVTVWLGARALRRRPWELAPLAILGAGHVAFAVFVLPVLDDRFLLPAVPAAVLLAVAGWMTLQDPLRRRVAVGVVAVAAIVAVDLHFAPPTFLTYPVELLAQRDGNSPWTRARGLSAASSVELRGWARHDEADPARAALHDSVWDVIHACGRGVCVATERQSGAIDRYGDQEWLRFRGLMDRVRGGPEVLVITTCPTHIGRLPQDCVADLAIEPLAPDGTAEPPGCADEGVWELHASVPDPDGGAGVSVWRKAGAPVCPLPAR
jgi:hypothetical protein